MKWKNFLSNILLEKFHPRVINRNETIKLYVTQKDTLIYKFFFNLDLGNYPYPSNQTGVSVQIINVDENYEYVVS